MHIFSIYCHAAKRELNSKNNTPTIHRYTWVCSSLKLAVVNNIHLEISQTLPSSFCLSLFELCSRKRAPTLFQLLMRGKDDNLPVLSCLPHLARRSRSLTGPYHLRTRKKTKLQGVLGEYSWNGHTLCLWLIWWVVFLLKIFSHHCCCRTTVTQLLLMRERRFSRGSPHISAQQH